MSNALDEVFSQKRMDKCTKVYQQILNNWISTKRLAYRVVPSEDLEGKTLAQMATLYYSVGIGNDLTDLPLLDMLVVFSMLRECYGQRQAGDPEPKELRVKTAFTEEEAFELLEGIVIETPST